MKEKRAFEGGGGDMGGKEEEGIFREIYVISKKEEREDNGGDTRNRMSRCICQGEKWRKLKKHK